MWTTVVCLFIHFLSFKPVQAQCPDLEWNHIQYWAYKPTVRWIQGAIQGFLGLDEFNLREFALIVDNNDNGPEKVLFTGWFCHKNTTATTSLYVAATVDTTASTIEVKSFGIGGKGEVKSLAVSYIASTHAFREGYTTQLDSISATSLFKTELEQQIVAPVVIGGSRELQNFWIVTENKEMVAIFKEGLKAIFVTMQILDDGKVTTQTQASGRSLLEVRHEVAERVKSNLLFHAGWSTDPAKLNTIKGFILNSRVRAPWVEHREGLCLRAVNISRKRGHVLAIYHYENTLLPRAISVKWSANSGAAGYNLTYVGYWTEDTGMAAAHLTIYHQRQRLRPMELEKFEDGVEWVKLGENMNTWVDWLRQSQKYILKEQVDTENLVPTSDSAWRIFKVGKIPFLDDSKCDRIVSMWSNGCSATYAITELDFIQLNSQDGSGIKVLFSGTLEHGTEAVRECYFQLFVVLKLIYKSCNSSKLPWQLLYPEKQVFSELGKNVENFLDLKIPHIMPVLLFKKHQNSLTILRGQVSGKRTFFFASTNAGMVTWVGKFHKVGDDGTSEISNFINAECEAQEYYNRQFAFSEKYTSHDTEDIQTYPTLIKSMAIGLVGEAKIEKLCNSCQLQYTIYNNMEYWTLWSTGPFETFHDLLQNLGPRVNNPLFLTPWNFDSTQYSHILHTSLSIQWRNKIPETAHFYATKLKGNHILIVFREPTIGNGGDYKYFISCGMYQKQELIILQELTVTLESNLWALEDKIVEMGATRMIADVANLNWKYDFSVAENEMLSYEGPTPWKNELNGDARLVMIGDWELKEGTIEICASQKTHKSHAFFLVKVNEQITYVGGAARGERQARRAAARYVLLPTAFVPTNLKNGIAWYTCSNSEVQETETIITTGIHFCKSGLYTTVAMGLLPISDSDCYGVFQYCIIVTIYPSGLFVSAVVDVLVTCFGIIRESFNMGPQRSSWLAAEKDLVKYSNMQQALNFKAVAG